MSDDKSPAWGEQESALIDSWWGALGALMVLQAYGFILFQGLIHLFVHDKQDASGLASFNFVVLPFLLIFALSQAGGLRVMNAYLKTHDWRMALRFWHSPIEILKFVMAILCTGAYLYLLTGHYPFPRNPKLYRDVGILGNLAFQLFSLVVAFVLNWMWKMSSAIEAMRAARGVPDDGQTERNGVIGVLLAIPMGILFVVISCYKPEFFYIVGVIGYGAIALALAPALTRSPRSWGVKQ